MSGNTSIIEYLNEQYKSCKQITAMYVKKTPKERLRQKFDLVRKEVYWLQQLDGFDRVPQLIKHNTKSFIMTYKGIQLTKENTPTDWESQINYIITSLEKLNVSHNDIQEEELLILNGKIQLIDFQHGTHGRAAFEKIIKSGKAVNRVRVDDRTAITEILQQLSKS